MDLYETVGPNAREREETWPCIYQSEAVTLRDGTTVTIRTMRSDDAPSMQAFYARLSPESIFSRFLVRRGELPYGQAKRLANADCQAQMALVATNKQEGEESIVAIAQYVAIPEGKPGLAEPAIVVAETFQNRGLGTLLLIRLAAHARAHGIRAFLVTCHSDNVRIRRIIQRSGLSAKTKVELGTCEIRVNLGTEPEHVDVWGITPAVATER